MKHIQYDEFQQSLQPLLAPANINASSFLATDYLNHYNEIVMLLEMVPDMPEMMDDVLDWAPKSYEQHFIDSGFDARDLAVEAFQHAPDILKTHFLSICADLDQLLSGTLFGLQKVNVIERGFSDAARHLVIMRVKEAQELLGRLNGIIHGTPDETLLRGGKITISETPEPQAEEQDEHEDTQTQAEIDALFD